MTTTELIVESYFRLCRKCFTLSDVKVINGNNRQFDLLAFRLPTPSEPQQQYHVEVSVIHELGWNSNSEQLIQSFEKKFFGKVDKNSKEKGDYAKGKSYQEDIFKTYESVGFDPKKVSRVWVCWTVNEKDCISPALDKFCTEKNLPLGSIEVISFRDRIMPDLQKVVGTANYADDALRTFSLIEQRRLQLESEDRRRVKKTE